MGVPEGGVKPAPRCVNDTDKPGAMPGFCCLVATLLP
jgi:hypothetical protein